MKKLLVLFALVLAACGAEDDGDSENRNCGLYLTCVDAPPIDAGIPDCIHPDAEIDAPDPCAACGAGEICVQFFNGTCGELYTECQPRSPTCDDTCGNCDVPHCRQANEPATFSCATAGCPDENPSAFQCYGV